MAELCETGTFTTDWEDRASVAQLHRAQPIWYSYRMGTVQHSYRRHKPFGTAIGWGLYGTAIEDKPFGTAIERGLYGTATEGMDLVAQL